MKREGTYRIFHPWRRHGECESHRWGWPSRLTASQQTDQSPQTAAKRSRTAGSYSCPVTGLYNHTHTHTAVGWRFDFVWCREHSAVMMTELLQPRDLACGTLFLSSCVILTSPVDCSDDSWRDTFYRNHEHGALWLLICSAKKTRTYLQLFNSPLSVTT